MDVTPGRGQGIAHTGRQLDACPGSGGPEVCWETQGS